MSVFEKLSSDEDDVTKGVKLLRVTAEDKTEVVGVPDSENPLNVEFYQQEEAFKIPPDYKARMAWDRYHNCYFVYVARVNKNNTASVCMWSMFEGLGLSDHLVAFLKSYDSRPKVNHASGKVEVLDMFKGKEEKLYEHEEKKWIKYWKDPDYASDHVMVRWCHRKTTDSYTMMLHTPVRSEKKLPNWDGPQLLFGIQSIRTLVAFMREARQQMLYEPLKDEEKENTALSSSEDEVDQ